MIADILDFDDDGRISDSKLSPESNLDDDVFLKSEGDQQLHQGIAFFNPQYLTTLPQQQTTTCPPPCAAAYVPCATSG